MLFDSSPTHHQLIVIHQFRRNVLSGKLEYRIASSGESEPAEWLPCSDIFKGLQLKFPTLEASNATKIKIGQTSRYLGCKSKHTKHGETYQLIPLPLKKVMSRVMSRIALITSQKFKRQMVICKR